jgi:hypothetical protein
MKREDVLSALGPLEPELKRLGFAKLFPFGSAARSHPQARDVDLLCVVAHPYRQPNCRILWQVATAELDPLGMACRDQPSRFDE